MDIVIVHETLPPCVVVSHLRGEIIGTQYSTSNTLPLVVTGSPLAVPYDEMNVMDKLWMWPIDEYKVAWLIQYKGRRPCTETFPKVLNSVLRNTTSYWNLYNPKWVSDRTLNGGEKILYFLTLETGVVKHVFDDLCSPPQDRCTLT